MNLEVFSQLTVIVSAILITVFFGLAVYFFIKGSKIKGGAGGQEMVQVRWDEVLKKQWQGVLEHFYSPAESDWKLAIIEADGILNEALLRKGYQGETMAEKLSSIDKKDLATIDHVWEAHKIRNKIVHEAGFRVEHSEAERAIYYFQEALKELGLEVG